MKKLLYMFILCVSIISTTTSCNYARDTYSVSEVDALIAVGKARVCGNSKVIVELSNDSVRTLSYVRVGNTYYYPKTTVNMYNNITESVHYAKLDCE